VADETRRGGCTLWGGDTLNSIVTLDISERIQGFLSRLLCQIELLNINRLKEAEAIHARLLKDVNEVNRKYLAEFEEKLKARKVRIACVLY